MRFTMAVPRQLQDALAGVQDLHFALASQDETVGYPEWYAKRKALGQQVILDNGMHEREVPKDVPELLEACKLFKPTYVIAPDKLRQPEWTLKQFRDMCKVRPTGTGIAVVMQGRDAVERFEYFEAVRGRADMLCFPYREPRLQWFKELLERVPKHVAWPAKLHLLGVSTTEELLGWREVLREYGVAADVVSIDTTKPIKWGLAGVRMDTIDNIREGPGWPQDPKAVPDLVTPEQIAHILYNVAFLRRFL